MALINYGFVAVLLPFAGLFQYYLGPPSSFEVTLSAVRIGVLLALTVTIGMIHGVVYAWYTPRLQDFWSEAQLAYLGAGVFLNGLINGTLTYGIEGIAYAFLFLVCSGCTVACYYLYFENRNGTAAS